MGIAATSAGTISIELMADMIRLEKDFAKAKRAMADMQVDVSSRAMSMGDSLEAMAGRAGRAGHAFEVAGRQVSASAGAQKAGMQQLGMQFGDMVTMYSLGAKPAQIFASQIGQVTQAIQLMSGGTSKVATFLGGPWGIGLAVAVTALAPFIARLFETKDALDDVGKAADSAMAKLRQSLAQASAVSDAATDSVQRLITAQAGLARANADIARTQADADALARTFGGGEAAQALYQRLGALERERIKQQDALKDAQNDLNEVQQAASVTIAMQTRNQERLNATEKETRTTKPKLTDAERAHIKAMKDAQREQEQAIEAAKSYAEQLEDQAAKFGKSTLEIQRMEVAAKAAAAPTAELADRIRAAGAALEEKQIAKAAEDFENMISQIYAEADLLPLVGKAREIAALQLEKQAKMAEWAAAGLTDLNEKWAIYAAARLNEIERKSVLERDAEAAERLREQIDGLIGGLSRMRGLPSIFGDISGVLSDKNPIAAMLGMGGIGTIAGSLLGGDALTKKMGDEFTESILKTFPGLNKTLAGNIGGTLANVFQGAGTGAAVGSLVFGNNQGSQIGSMIGGALGQEFGAKVIGAVSSKLLGSLGSAAGPLGAIAGSLLGGLIGGIFKGGPDWATTNLATGQAGGNKDQQKQGVSQAASAFDDAMRKIADAFGATMGEFQTSIGLHNGNWHVSTTGRTGTLRTTRGWADVTDYGADSKAALTAAIKDAISDGAFAGLSEGVERLLEGEGDLDTQIKKALSFQGVFDALQQEKDPQGFALMGLDKEFAHLREVFTEAGASTAEYAQLEELYQLRRKEITEQTANAAGSASELERTRRQMEIQLMELSGDAAGALAATRQIELDGMDASLHGLAQQIYARQDEVKAAALAQQSRQLDIALMEATGNAAGALAARRQDELAALDESLRAKQQEVWAAQDAAQAARDLAAATEDMANRAAAAASRMSSLQIRLAEAQGNTSLAGKLRQELELAQAQSDAERDLLKQIYAAEAEAAKAAEAQAAASAAAAAAQQAAQKAEEIARQREGLEIQLLRAQGKEGEALARERAAQLNALDESLRALQVQVWQAEMLKAEREAKAAAVETARAELSAAYERESQALQANIDKFRDLRGTLTDFRKGLFQGAGFDSFAALQSRLDQTSGMANMGQEQALRDLPKVSQDYLTAFRAQAGSMVDYQLETARVARMLDQAIGATDAVIDYDEMNLAALNRSVDALIEVKDEIRSVRQAIENLQAKIDAQTGTLTEVGKTQIRATKEQTRLLEDAVDGVAPLTTQPAT